MSKTITVILDVQRHGQKAKPQKLSGETNEDVLLTPEGREQVANAVKQHLMGERYDAAWCSNKPRAIETGAIFLATTRQSGLGLCSVEPFDYAHIEDLMKNDDAYTAEVERLTADNGDIETIGMWRQVAPVACGEIIEQLTQFIEELAQGAEEDDKTVTQHYAASHTPVAEMLVPDDSFRVLGLAGIIRYTAKVIGGELKSIEHEVIFLGF